MYASSLDSYVRVYNLESKVLEEKLYTNKPIYSINLRVNEDEADKNEFK